MTVAEDRKPILVVVAGANGSGKTTLTQQLLLDKWLKDVEYLNPDAIAQERFGGWNDPKAIVQAANFVAEAREAALARYESIAFETVFSAPDKLASSCVSSMSAPRHPKSTRHALRAV